MTRVAAHFGYLVGTNEAEPNGDDTQEEWYKQQTEGENELDKRGAALMPPAR
jgi:hypothetical protein